MTSTSVAILGDQVIFTVAASGVMTWTFTRFDTGFAGRVENISFFALTAGPTFNRLFH